MNHGMSVESSLSFITENSPAWVARLDDLTGQIASRQAELSELAARPLKPKHGSTESLRPSGSNEGVAENPFELSPAQAGAAKQYKATQLLRKRKTASLASGSGTATYRTRSMIIVYYDSAVQEAFEMIVRNIGTARNNIRKARMQATMMMKMTSLVDDSANDDDSADKIRAQLAAQRSARSKGLQERSVFDTLDAGLDFSQSQCERAAHQFLRDGDCAPEILSIRNKIEEMAALATKELERMKAAGQDAASSSEAKAPPPLTRAQEREKKLKERLKAYGVEDDDGVASAAGAGESSAKMQPPETRAQERERKMMDRLKAHGVEDEATGGGDAVTQQHRESRAQQRERKMMDRLKAHGVELDNGPSMSLDSPIEVDADS